MADREKVILRCREAIDSREPEIDYCFYFDVIDLLKEQEEREKQICKKICAFIRQGCSTDTDADKAHVCNVIQQCFFHLGSEDVDMAKVISGLQHCDSAGCFGCVYYEEEDSCKLNKDALKLINEQAEKIKSLEQTIEDICCGGGAE